MKAYIQKYEHEGLVLTKEENSVLAHCIVNDIQIVRWSDANEISHLLDANDVVIGSITGIHDLLSLLGLETPTNTDYPKCLSEFLLRDIRLTTASELLFRVAVEGECLFSKPLKLKLFTGKVFTPVDGLTLLRNLPPEEPVYISSILEWEAEFRVYISKSEILAACRYDDNPKEELEINMDVVRKAIVLLNESENAPTSYTLDFGLTKSGETALIEMNDGYALGKYKGISDKDYFNFIADRWYEITESYFKNKEQK